MAEKDPTQAQGKQRPTAPLRAGQKRADSALDKEAPSQFPLGRNNFILMCIAGVMIVAGFLLMLGGSSTEEAFNPDIFSARRIVVGPTIAFLGFLFMGYGIIRRPKEDATDSVPNDTTAK